MTLLAELSRISLRIQFHRTLGSGSSRDTCDIKYLDIERRTRGNRAPRLANALTKLARGKILQGYLLY